MSEPSQSLPAGWDESRIRNATPQELDALSEEEFSLIQNHIASQIRFGLGASEPIPQPPASPSNPPSATPMTPPKPTAPYIEALRKTNLLGDHWGFAVFRLDYNSSTDAAWEAYTQRLVEEFQAAVHRADEYAEDGMEEARAGLGILWADDSREEVQGQGIDAVRAEYRVMRERGDVPAGMDHGVCLVADAAAIRSLERAAAPLGSTALGVRDPAYVLAVDTEWEGQGSREDDDGYTGQFRVAVASLLDELFPVLATGTLKPKELAMMVEEDEIWIGVV